MNAHEMTIWACMMRSCSPQLSEGECLIRHLMRGSWLVSPRM